MRFKSLCLSMSICVTLAGLSAVSANATPVAAGDDLDKMLADKGLLSQLEQVRQTVGNKASDLVVNAMGFLGVPYKRGGNSAETGFDCSGFVRAMYEQTIGLVLPRRADQQAAATQSIDKADLKPGDLVFFNTLRRTFSHVGIYVGEGRFIHSPKPGAQVRVENMKIDYWSSRFDGARRVQATTAERIGDRVSDRPADKAVDRANDRPVYRASDQLSQFGQSNQ